MSVFRCAFTKILPLKTMIVLPAHTSFIAQNSFKKMLSGQGTFNVFTPFHITTNSFIIGNDTKKQFELLEHRFKDALELLEDAKLSVGTVYFSADMKEAQDFIEETLMKYRRLLSALNDEEKQTLGHTARLKMDELKAQLDILKDSVKSKS